MEKLHDLFRSEDTKLYNRARMQTQNAANSLHMACFGLQCIGL